MEPDGTRVVALVTVFIGFEKEKHIITRPLSLNLNTIFVAIYEKRDSSASKQIIFKFNNWDFQEIPVIDDSFYYFCFPVNDVFNPIHATDLFQYPLKTSENQSFLFSRGIKSDQWHEMG